MGDSLNGYENQTTHHHKAYRDSENRHPAHHHTAHRTQAAPPLIPTNQARLHNAGHALVGCACLISFFNPQLGGVSLFLFFTCGATGMVLAPRRRMFPLGPGVVSVAVLYLSTVLALVAAIASPNGQTAYSGSMVVMATAFLLFACVDHPHRVLMFVFPGLVLHLIFVLGEMALLAGRVDGLAGNVNPAGALLVVTAVLGCHYLPRRIAWPFALCCGVGLLGTGSRLSILVAFVCVSLIAYRKTGPARWGAVTGLLGLTVALLAVGAGWVDYNGFDRLNGVGPDLLARLTPSNNPSIFPQGFQIQPVTHSVPVLLMVQTGTMSLVAWGLLTSRGLLFGAMQSTRWWVLLCLSVISLLDYHAFWGSLAPLWWLVVLPTTNPGESATAWGVAQTTPTHQTDRLRPF
jgi:hypothetical protein